MTTPSDEAIEAELLRLAAVRPRTFCPSEAALALAEDWRPLMPRVREAAARLADRGHLAATRRGEPVGPLDPGGPIRLSRPRGRS